MKYKKFRFYKLLIVMILAGIVGAFVSLGNFVIPLIAFFIALVVMLLLKKNVDEKLTDEMLEKVGGMASRIVMVVSTVVMALASIVLVSLKEKFPEYLIVGYTLSYFACGMLLLYSALFKFFLNKKI